jgi:hypothetical protein
MRKYAENGDSGNVGKHPRIQLVWIEATEHQCLEPVFLLLTRVLQSSNHSKALISYD